MNLCFVFVFSYARLFHELFWGPSHSGWSQGDAEAAGWSREQAFKDQQQTRKGAADRARWTWPRGSGPLARLGDRELVGRPCHGCSPAAPPRSSREDHRRPVLPRQRRAEEFLFPCRMEKAHFPFTSSESRPGSQHTKPGLFLSLDWTDRREKLRARTRPGGRGASCESRTGGKRTSWWVLSSSEGPSLCLGDPWELLGKGCLPRLLPSWAAQSAGTVGWVDPAGTCLDPPFGVYEMDQGQDWNLKGHPLLGGTVTKAPFSQAFFFNFLNLFDHKELEVQGKFE